jgi:hypothetical protein
MKRRHLVALGAFAASALALLSLQACAGDDNAIGAPGVDASKDTSVADSTMGDSQTPDGSEAGGDGGCPAAWTGAPTVDPSIAIPGDAGGVILHAAATGTQDYVCTGMMVDAGDDGGDGGDGGTTYAWVFSGPEADLKDCNATKIGTHFASDGGATRPEWMELGGDYVIGKRHAGFTPDGGAPAIPWLLLDTVSTGGTGTLTRTTEVQRINTTGGLAPSTTCDSTTVGTTQKVPYTADYYFYGN